jgi:hypothetical protein
MSIRDKLLSGPLGFGAAPPRQSDARRNAESSEGIALRTLNRRAFQIVGFARYIPT